MPTANMTQIRATAVLLAAGVPQSQVAILVGKKQATISQQVTRNTGGINEIIEQIKPVFTKKIESVNIKGEF